MGSCRTMCLGFAWIPDDLGIWRVFFIFYFFEEVVDGGSVLPILTISYHGKPDLTCSINVKPMPGKHSGHASKNGAGQLVSPLRTIMFGQYFTDSSGARKWGLPPAVFRRSEPMSDAMNAALWNPYYVISSTATWLQSYEIFQKFSEYFRYCQNLSDIFIVCSDCSELFRYFQNFHMVSECFRMFQNISDVFRNFQGMFPSCSLLPRSQEVAGKLASVSWSCQGFLILNLCIALCTVPGFRYSA